MPLGKFRYIEYQGEDAGDVIFSILAGGPPGEPIDHRGRHAALDPDDVGDVRSDTQIGFQPNPEYDDE